MSARTLLFIMSGFVQKHDVIVECTLYRLVNISSMRKGCYILDIDKSLSCQVDVI